MCSPCRTRGWLHRARSQSKAHTAACLVSPSRAGPIEIHVLVVRKVDYKNVDRQKLLRVGPSILEFHHVVFFFALLLCSCITHGPPGSVLVAVTVQQQLRCETSPLSQSQAVLLCVCVCLCAFVCTRYVCVAGMLSQNHHTAAPQQQWYNSKRRVSSSYPCLFQQSRCACGSWTGGDRAMTTT